jgi:hypothetical protein
MSGFATSRLRSLFGKTPGDALFEKALEFGWQYYAFDLRPLLAKDARETARWHLEQPGRPQTKEEVFFLLAGRVLHRLSVTTRNALARDIAAYQRVRTVSETVFRTFTMNMRDLTVEKQDYWDWVEFGKGQKGLI